MTVDDPTKVHGVPASAKARWAQAHIQVQKKEGETVDPEKGPWRLTLDMPSYVAVMSHLPVRELREAGHRASVTRASEFSTDPTKNNIPIVHEILKLKRTMTNMLGFDNFAQQSLAAKMAPSIAAVTDLSDLIA